jgi:hypothetical protein
MLSRCFASKVRSTTLIHTGLQPGVNEYGENQVTVSTVSITASEWISMRLNDFTNGKPLKRFLVRKGCCSSPD